MRGRNLLIVGISIFVGLIAVYLANSYFNGVEERQVRSARQNSMARIVVATQPVAFGQPLTTTNTRLADWPANSVPPGAFSSVDQATAGGRVALRSIQPGEVVLAANVSGSGGRATLAATLEGDMRAITIPMSDVASVGGFVRPGDVVDVLLTRQIPGEGSQTTDKMTTVALENVQVLAIDQVADANSTDPVVSKTATLKTDLYGAQKLALAREIGVLSLALRNVTNQTVGATSTVVASDLGGDGQYIPGRGNSGGGSNMPNITIAPAAFAPRAAAASLEPAAPRRPRGPTMSVVRGTESSAYEVERLRGY